MVALSVAIVGSVAAGLLMVWLYKILPEYMRLKAMVDRVPGPSTLPLIGNAHQLKAAAPEFYSQLMGFSEEYNHKMFRLWLGTQPVVVLSKAECAEILLNSTKHIDKSPLYRFVHPWLGTGLLTSTGQKWKSRRRLLTPTFHFKILSDFLCIFNEQATILTSKLQTEVDKGSFNIFSYITLCALDIICVTAMGRNINAQVDSDSEYVQDVHRMAELIQNRQKAPWLWSDFIYSLTGSGRKHEKCLKTLHDFTLRVIKEKQADFDKQNKAQLTLQEYTDNLPIDQDEATMGSRKKRLAFLDMLLYAAEDGSTLTEEDIREEVDTFMFEGHDTTASAANWAIHLIGSHPTVQEMIHQELDSIFGKSDRDATVEDLKDMKYLECVIKETLRLFPSVPMFGRSLTEDATIDGILIPKGTTALVLAPALHRDAAHFPDPERFDPDRFSQDSVLGRHPFAYIPFSAGLRNCIGQRFALMEEKVILSSILRKFRIESTQKREELNPMGELILRPANGIHVKLSHRL